MSLVVRIRFLSPQRRALGVRPPVLIGQIAGEYRNRQASVRVNSNASRRLAVTASHAQGSYYEGDLRSDSLTMAISYIAVLLFTGLTGEGSARALVPPSFHRDAEVRPPLFSPWRRAHLQP